MKEKQSQQFNTERPASRSLARYAVSALFCLLLCLFFSCSSDPQPIVINEVVSSNSALIDEALGTPDWIELHNRSDTAVNLQGYILTDKEDRYDLGNMLPNIVIPANGYTVLFAHSNAAGDPFCLPFGLSKGGDTLFLLDPSGNLLEKLVIPALPENVSYARRADGTFGYCISPTPESENTEEISDTCPAIQTPEEDPDVQKNDEPSEIALFITEIMSNDFDTGRFDGADWIELYNPNDEDLALEGFFLSDREDKADKAPLPAVTIAAKQYLVIPFGSGDDRIDMGVSSYGETVTLYDSELRVVDSVAVPSMLKGQSWAKNRNGNFGCCGSPTPGEQNDDHLIGIEKTRPADESEPLRISEVLFRNTYSVIDRYGDHSDFLELYNAGSEAIDLSEYWLSDDFSDPLKWRCPAVSVEPGAYLLIFLSGKDSAETELHAPFSISSSDDGILLFHAARRMTQQVPRLDAVPKNTSVGLREDGSLVFFRYPTPGAKNAASVDDVAELGAFPADDVHINEVSAIGSDGDWIELRNGSSTAADLSGWYLTDNPEKEHRFYLRGELAAFACAVFAPDSFGIAATGETVFLFDADDNLRDLFETGDLSDGVTSGRTDDRSVPRVFFLKATPNVENDAAFVSGRTSAPVLSESDLYHTEPFSVEIRCADPNAVVYYSLDGNEPTDRSARYSEPILISDSVTLRAVAQSDGCLPSRIVAATYLFTEPHTLPVVCISCNPKDFRTFTLINSQKKYPHTDAQIAYYEPDGTLGTAFAADINPRGNQSIKNPQKSLSVHLRARLGQGSVRYPFWGEDTALDYASLILRNGSQDYAKARLRDSFALYAVSNLSLDSARTRPVVVYVNGVYYGIMDLNEGMNQDYLVTHYGVDPALISHISTNETVRYGSNKDFLRVRKFARQNPFSDDAVVAEFAQWVDVDYILDYVIAQTFFCNYDVKNQSYWATSDYAIRWRPVFYDIDRCFADGSYRRNLFNSYFDMKGVLYDAAAGRVANMDLYASLRKNRAWCDRFVRRYAELLQTEFTVDRLQALLDQVAAALRPEMERHIALYHAPASLEDWEAYVASMREEIVLRHEEIQKQICSEFRLSRAEWNAILKETAPKN